jgi:hypothetical protein
MIFLLMGSPKTRMRLHLRLNRNPSNTTTVPIYVTQSMKTASERLTKDIAMLLFPFESNLHPRVSGLTPRHAPALRMATATTSQFAKVGAAKRYISGL